MRRSTHLWPALLGILAFCLVMLMVARPAHGDLHTWIGGNGFWNDPVHWSSPGGGIPGNGDDASILSASDLTVWCLGYYTSDVLGTVQLDGSGGATVLMNQGDGTAMRAATEYVGVNGHGEYYQHGGTNDVGSLYLAWNPNSIGAYRLAYSSLGAQLTASTIAIAYDINAVGTFNHDDGTVTCGSLLLGNYHAASRAYYNLAGGTLSATTGVIIGNVGAGTFTQTGGIGTLANLQIGAGAASSGVMNLNAGTMNVTGITAIGTTLGAQGALNLGGTAYFNAGGDINVIGGRFTQNAGGFNLAAGGRINVSHGGTVTFNTPYVMPPSTGIVVSNGQVNVNSYLDIGRIGNGSLLVDGNSSSITGYGENWWGSGVGNNATITFSNNGQGTFGSTVLGRSGGAGTLAINVASVTFGDLTAGTGGGTGFIQVGGSSIAFASLKLSGASKLELGVGGTGVISVGSLGILGPGTGTVTIGTGGTIWLDAGQYDQQGPIVVDGGQFYCSPNSWWGYYLSTAPRSLTVRNGGMFTRRLGWNVLDDNSVESAGLLDIGTGEIEIWSPATLHIAGGRVNVGTFEFVGTGGTVNFNSGTLNITGPAGLSFAPGGPLGGSFSLPSTRALLVNNATTITTGSELSITGGTLTTGSLYIESGGTLSMPGSGIINVTTGTPTALGGNFRIGIGGNGTVTLRGALHSTWSGYTHVGYDAPGTFLHQAGLHEVGHMLTLGDMPGGSGYYRLETGTLTCAYEVVGWDQNAPAVFDQLGGTNQVDSQFWIAGGHADSSGIFNLQGGTLTVGLGGPGDGAYIGGTQAGPGGHGTMSITGGTCNIAGNLTIWDNGTLIVNGGTVRVSTSGPEPLAASGLFIGSAGGSGTVNLAGWLSSSPFTVVGNGGQGTFLQTGGVNNSPNLNIGQAPGSTGYYRLDSGTLLTTSGVIGFYGLGTFVHNGGLFDCAGRLDVGDDSIGYYMQNGGTLQTENLVMGLANGAYGLFDQLGGTHRCQYMLALANGSSGTLGSASYNLYDGTLTVPSGVEWVGGIGRGTFSQYGGVNRPLSLQLGGGSLASGTFLLQSGELTVAQSELIGNEGLGTFTQLGGVHTIGGSLSIGGWSSPGAGGTLNLNGGTVTSGSTRVWNNGRINYNGGRFSTGSLTLLGGGDVMLSTGANKTLRCTSVSIDTINGSKIDLANNKMIVDYAGASPIASIRQLLVSGSAGNWTGNGITSSSAAADSTKGIGYGEASVLGLISFGGYSVDATSILLKYTWEGDANLDGQVDISDLARLATNWQTSNVWTGGDFDYSGFVDITDLAMLATNWQVGVGTPVGQSLSDAVASLGLPHVAVPEPASVGFALFPAGAAVLRRRRTT